MYKCAFCGTEFDEPKQITERSWYEGWPMDERFSVCPVCGQDQFEEEPEDDPEE